MQQRPARPPAARRFSLTRLVRANLYDTLLLLRESRFVLLIFGLLVLSGTVYLRLTYPNRYGYTAAFYETLKLLTLQSGEELPADWLGRVLFFLIPMLGLVLIFQSVLNFGRLLLDKTSRREAWQVALASTYSQHTVVCGLGRVGMRVVTKLVSAGYHVVVVEREWNSEFVQRMLALKVPVVLGDAREATVLRQAGVQRASAIIATTTDDLVNIELALTARTLQPAIRTVLRVFQDDFDTSLERAFGQNAVYSTSALAAPTFAAAAVSRDVDYVVPVGNELLGISRLTIQHNSTISGFVRGIETAHAIRVLRHQSAGRLLRPEMMRTLNSGDQVLLLGSLAALDTLRAKNMPGSKLRFLSATPLQRPDAPFNRVIVCGMNRSTIRTVQQLAAMQPRPRVVLIYNTGNDPEFAASLANLDVGVIVGDPRELAVLQQAGLDQADAVVALAQDDLLNLAIGLTVRRQRPDVHLVLRVFSDALAERLADMFGIRTAYSTSGLAGPTLAAAAVLGDVTHGFFVDNLLYAVDELTVAAGNRLLGQSIDTIRARDDVLVIGLCRGSNQPLPPLETVVQAGDTLTLLGTIDAIRRVRQ